MPRSKKRTVEVGLGYYKQGDDLGRYLKEEETPEEALRAHADSMRSVAKHLDDLANMVEGHKIRIQADTHMIEITCEEKLANQLIKAGLARKGYEEE